MCFYNTSIFAVFLSLGLSVTAMADLSILAPEIICPESGNNTLGRPDYSIIRIVSETHSEMDKSWSVNWSPITTVSQRQTIMAWNSVRDLEKKLNGPQAEPLLSAIKNNELVSGVKYILNLTANTSDELITKSFSIKYSSKDKQDATVSTNDEFSLVLLGGRITYPDLDFIIEADVTTCSTTQNYYFNWRIISTTTDQIIDVSENIGSRLEIPRFTLKPGVYRVNCQLRNDNDHVLIKEVEVPILVHSRGLGVFLSADKLIVSTDSAFTVESKVVNHDNESYSVEYEWICCHNGEPCNFIEDGNESSFNFSSGIPSTGEYSLQVIVTVLHQWATANMTIIAVTPSLPILQIEPVPRVINQGTISTVSGKASRVLPFCRITWYFVAEESPNSAEWQGIPISETYTAFSLEENFLSELTDFTNDTGSVEIEVEITSSGRARFVAECNCTSSFNSETTGVTATYAEVHFQLNESPEVKDLVVSPETGSALETLFQIRSRAKDADRPLRYSFYCATGPNLTLLLSSYLEYDTVQTFLPFVDGETLIWVEVCDAFGCCSKSKTRAIPVRPSSGNTFDLMTQYTRAFIRRCEVQRLMHVAISVVISYTKAGQLELADLYTRALLESLPGLRSCSIPEHRYAVISEQLAAAGLDVASLLA